MKEVSTWQVDSDSSKELTFKNTDILTLAEFEEFRKEASAKVERNTLSFDLNVVLLCCEWGGWNLRLLGAVIEQGADKVKIILIVSSQLHVKALDDKLLVRVWDQEL